MDLPISLQDITYAENYLAQGDLATATPLLERLVELAEEYIDAECKTEEKRQYFSFDSKFERLAYRRVEKDPRELVQVEVPFDRLYSDMAFAYIRQQDYVSARNALMQAVRWDPMNCNYRLDLAELFRALEDKQEWASLSFSVLERASDGKCAAQRLRQSRPVLLGARDRERFGCRGLRASGAAPGAQRCAYDAPAQQDPYHLSGCR